MTDEQIHGDLTRLGTYVSHEIRSRNLSVYYSNGLLKSFNDNAIETQIGYFDSIGIPMCLVLNADTLKTGMAKLRNRDTSITEEIHLSELKDRLEKWYSAQQRNVNKFKQFSI